MEKMTHFGGWGAFPDDEESHAWSHINGAWRSFCGIVVEDPGAHNPPDKMALKRNEACKSCYHYQKLSE